MKMDIEIKGMKLIDEDREAAKSNAARILQAYSDKLKKMKGEDNNGR